ncbi:MAG: VOC family protein [Candidatus Korobacteraceae bacterium]
MANVKPKPDNYHSVTPYLIIKGAARAIDFYKKVFDARDDVRMDGPGGKIMHAEIKIGDSMVMLADEMPEMGHRSPVAYGGTPVSLVLYVPDADAVAAKLTASGGKTIKPLENQFWGDRMGTFADPFGHVWSIATHVEDVTPDEMQRRMAAMQPTH